MATALYSIALLASAFLLFCIEPLVAKMLLPISGGVPAVWSTCLVFFQMTLLAGYAFTRVTLGRMRPRVQALVYVVLFPAALLSLPIVIPRHELGAYPALSVLLMLSTAVAVPFFVLSTLAPALQRWFSATGAAHAADPYFLYAASNAGSLIALAAYPIVIEPASDLGAQSRALRIAFAVLAVLVGACAYMMGAPPPNPRKSLSPLRFAPRSSMMKDAPVSEKREEDAAPIAWARRARWVVLAAIPSAQLVAVTSHVTTTVAPAPLLWAVPLAAYLASFVLVFARRPIPHAFVTKRLPFIVTVGMLLLVTGANHPEWVVIALHVIVLLGVASYCHGAIAEDRPPPARLPEFYMWMSVGGAVGGAVAALVAPLVLKQPTEYPLCLLFTLACLPNAQKAPRWARVLAPGAVLVAIIGDVVFAHASGHLESAVAVAPVLVAFALDRFPRLMTWALAGVVLMHSSVEDVRGHVLVRERSFFGAFSVVRIGGETSLKHGNTMHGLQLASSPRTPTICFAEDGPIGEVIDMMHAHDRLHRAAVIGLGAGTLATFAHEGEHWRFFELDPAIIRIALDPKYFTFLRDAFGDKSDVVAGDARIEIAKDPIGNYDLLVVDAFTSDSIPTHLLTREALATYRTKLAKGAFIAWNITNRYLDLKAVLAALAKDAGLVAMARDDGAITPARLAKGIAPSLWVVMAESADDLTDLVAKHWEVIQAPPGFRVWTDERASIVTVWK